MILLVHIIFGVAVGSLAKNPFLAVLLAYFSHYFLDFIPHIDYKVDNILEKNWKKSFGDFTKVFIDATIGLCFIFFIYGFTTKSFLCAFFATLPDGFAYLGAIWPNKFTKWHHVINGKNHYFKYKKIPTFLRVATQVVAVAIAVIILR